MLSRNKIAEVNGWCYLLTILTSILLLASCVPTTLNTTGTTPVRASDGYAEIKEIEEKLSITSEPTTAEMLIEKLRHTRNINRWTRSTIPSEPL